MNTIRLILICLISLATFNTYANNYYGTLRGASSLELKSPYNGVVKKLQTDKENVYLNDSPFTIDSYELESKSNILKIKIENSKSKIKRLERDYKSAKKYYELGYVSRSDMDAKEDVLKDAFINMEELRIELNALERMLGLGKPTLNFRYIIRDVYTLNNQVVNAGDIILKLENVDKFIIDIKYDPVALDGRIQDKRIVVKSLVTGAEFDASIEKIYTSGDNVFHGSKMVSILLEEYNEDLVQLLDTVFEVRISD
ncbi:hypothetical protein G3142_005581 [Salmonella enterica subsp. enterica serovar Montevideo]|nr:hypothetical protein [Salmonella enterica subsp. enterica serovar Montevideo]